MKTNSIVTLLKETQAQTLVWVRLSSVSSILQNNINLVTWLRNYFLHLQSARFIPSSPSTYIAKDEDEDALFVLAQSKYSGKLRLDRMPCSGDRPKWEDIPAASFDLLRLQAMIERAGIAIEDEYINDILYTATDDIVV